MQCPCVALETIMGLPISTLKDFLQYCPENNCLHCAHHVLHQSGVGGRGVVRVNIPILIQVCCFKPVPYEVAGKD